MKLTGKAKEQFEKWYVANNYHEQFFLKDVHQRFSADYFEDLPNSMQWGVYQDWADSLGINVEVFSEADYPDAYFDYRITEKKAASFWGRATIAEYTTRQEARNAAIEKLNQLINET